MELLSDPVQFTVVAAAVLLMGVAKVSFGGAPGILAVPVMAQVLPAQMSVGILLPLMLLADTIAIWYYRKKCQWSTVWKLVPGTIIGTVIATMTMKQADDLTIKKLLGAICLLFVGIYLLQKWILKHESRLTPGWKNSTFFGMTCGYVSAIAHAGGPVMVMYFLPQHLAPAIFIGTKVCYFGVNNAIKLPPYIWAGIINPTTLLWGLWTFPFVLIGTGIGIWINHKVSPDSFVRIIYILLFITGLKLVWG